MPSTSASSLRFDKLDQHIEASILSFLTVEDVSVTFSINKTYRGRGNSPDIQKSIREKTPYSFVYTSSPIFAKTHEQILYYAKNQCIGCGRVDLEISKLDEIRGNILQDSRTKEKEKKCTICSPFSSASLVILLHDIYNLCFSINPSISTFKKRFQKAYGRDIGRFIKPVTTGVLTLEDLLSRDRLISSVCKLCPPKQGMPFETFMVDISYVDDLHYKQKRYINDRIANRDQGKIGSYIKKYVYAGGGMSLPHQLDDKNKNKITMLNRSSAFVSK